MKVQLYDVWCIREARKAKQYRKTKNQHMGNKDLSGIHKTDTDGNSNIRQCRLQGKNH